MKSKMMAMFVAGLALAVGALLVTPSAEALNTTTKKVATVSVSSTANYTLLLGLDGNIWYTFSSSTGSIKANTGNANNPFDISGVSFLANGFVTTGAAFCSGGAVTNAATAVGVCSQEWVKFPGAANFNDGPTASLFGPLSASPAATVVTNNTLQSALPASAAVLINILAPGLDGNVWYTMFDGTGTTANATSMNKQSATTGVGQVNLPGSDPFTVTGWNNNTGFVSTSAVNGLAVQCGTLGSLSRTCIGIWAPYP